MTMTESMSFMERFATVRDALAVGRAFGESYQAGGATIIPVASVMGGGGGGTAGPETAADGAGADAGTGLGFGTWIRPVGIVVVREGEVTWQPMVDVTLVVLGAQLVGVFTLLTLRRLLRRR
jgi:uncharacterized spore protein YtfJ